MQIQKMHDLFELANNWFSEIQHLSPEQLTRLMTFGKKVQRVLNVTDKLTFRPSKKDGKPSL
jgi:hypothetical protein